VVLALPTGTEPSNKTATQKKTDARQLGDHPGQTGIDEELISCRDILVQASTRAHGGVAFQFMRKRAKRFPTCPSPMR